MPQLIQRDAVASSPSFSRPAARAARRACPWVIYILTLSSWLLRRRRPSLKVLISRSVSSFIRSSTRWSFDGNLKIKFYWMKSFIRLNFYFTSVFTPFNSSNPSQRKILLESTKIEMFYLFIYICFFLFSFTFPSKPPYYTYSLQPRIFLDVWYKKLST